MNAFVHQIYLSGNCPVVESFQSTSRANSADAIDNKDLLIKHSQR